MPITTEEIDKEIKDIDSKIGSKSKVRDDKAKKFQDIINGYNRDIIELNGTKKHYLLKKENLNKKILEDAEILDDPEEKTEVSE